MITRGRTLSPEQAEKKTRFLYWWLLLVIFFEYARPASYFPPLGALPLNSALPLGLTLVSFFAAGLRPAREIFKDRMARWPLVFLAFILFSMLYAEVSMRAYLVFKLTLGYLFLYWIIVRIVTNEQRLRGVFLTLIVCHLFLLAMNPEVVLDPNARHYIRGASFLGDGNDYSLSLCILLPLAMLLALQTQKKTARLFYWGVMGILLLAVIGTQSRGATLGLGAVFGYLWLQSSRKGAGLVAILGAIVIVLIYAPPVYFQRIGTITNYENESSAEGRIQAWKAGTRMAANNVLGVGAGNFPNSFPKYRSDDAPVRWMTAHSMYFLILGELGILGLLLLFKLIFGNVIENMRLRRELVKKATGPPQSAAPKVAAAPNLELDRSVTLLKFMNASMFGFAVAGAFLSVAYYPHIFVLTGLMMSARSIVAARAGIDLLALQAPLRKGRRTASRGMQPPQPAAAGSTDQPVRTD
jgi:probable O-glycosylation ligase (exosortase A-associated)